MKLERLKKLQIWLVIISTVVSIICNIRNDRRQSEKHKRWIEECNKLDAKIHNFEPVIEAPKKEEGYPRNLGCSRCMYRTVPMSEEPCLSCVTRGEYGFKEG